jgi:hypothetical protein
MHGRCGKYEGGRRFRNACRILAGIYEGGGTLETPTKRYQNIKMDLTEIR